MILIPAKLDNILITTGSISDLEQVFAIYESSFPANERHPEQVIMDRIINKTSTLFIAQEGSVIHGFALVHDFKDTPFVLLDYLAINSKKRNSGIGSKMLSFLTERHAVKEKIMIIEAENPLFGDNKKERQMRMNFYLKNGASVVENINYLLPPLDGTNPTEMNLLTVPKLMNAFTKAELINLVKLIYLNIYNRFESDEYYKKTIESIQSN